MPVLRFLDTTTSVRWASTLLAGPPQVVRSRTARLYESIDRRVAPRDGNALDPAEGGALLARRATRSWDAGSPWRLDGPEVPADAIVLDLRSSPALLPSVEHAEVWSIEVGAAGGPSDASRVLSELVRRRRTCEVRLVARGRRGDTHRGGFGGSSRAGGVDDQPEHRLLASGRDVDPVTAPRECGTSGRRREDRPRGRS